MFSLENGRLCGDHIVAFQYIVGAYRKAGQGLFVMECSDRAGGSGFKLKEGGFRLDTGKILFTVKMVRH